MIRHDIVTGTRNEPRTGILAVTFQDSFFPFSNILHPGNPQDIPCRSRGFLCKNIVRLRSNLIFGVRNNASTPRLRGHDNLQRQARYDPSHIIPSRPYIRRSPPLPGNLLELAPASEDVSESNMRAFTQISRAGAIWPLNRNGIHSCIVGIES